MFDPPPGRAVSRESSIRCVGAIPGDNTISIVDMK